MQVIDSYARVSRKGDRNQRSTTGQHAANWAVVQERGLPRGEEFTDDGRSAWNPRVVREDWAKLMTRLESGVSGGVAVFDLERFTRQPKEGERLIEAAERGMVVLDSDGEFDLTTASGKKSFRDAMAAAAYYSDRLSDRVKRGKLSKARAGEIDRGGDTHRAFGFEPDNVTIRESEAEVIRILDAHFLHGDSQDALVAWLNRMGIETSYGKPWNRASLRWLLTRDKNAGWITHRGVRVARLPGEPIVDQETHDRVLAKFAERRRGRPASPRYLCSGVAFCGRCGTRLTGRPKSRVKPYQDGEQRREYWCAMGHNNGCGRLTIDQRGLDEAARELALAILSDPRHAAQIEKAAAATAEAARDLDALIAEAEKTATAIGDRLGRGELSLERHDAIVRPLDVRLAKLRQQRQELAGPSTPVPAKASYDEWAQRWKVATPEGRRDLLKMALRGRVLMIGPADKSERTNVTLRIQVAEK